MSRNSDDGDLAELIRNAKALFGYEGSGRNSIDRFREFFVNSVLKEPKALWNDPQTVLFWKCVRLFGITEYRNGRFPEFEGFGTLAKNENSSGSNFWTQGAKPIPRLIFRDCEFESSAMFLSDSTEELSFSDCKFEKDSYLCGTRKQMAVLRCGFSGNVCLNASKVDNIFISDSDFNGSFAARGVIGNGLTICGTKFERRAELSGCEFQNLHIENSEFKEDIWGLAMGISEKFSIYESSVDGNVFLDGLRMTGSKCDVDFRRSRISANLSLNLENPCDFEKARIGLYLSSIPNFFSDQAELSLAKPLSEGLGNESCGDISFFDAGSFNDDESRERHALEIQLHEIRLLRNIGKRLGIHEMDDALYEKEMGISIKIKTDFGNCADWVIGWTKLLAFGKMFGWGVRIGNLILTGLLIMFGFFGWYWTWGGTFEYGNGKSVALSGDLGNSAYLSATSFFGGTIPNFADGITRYGEPLEYMVFGESVLGLLWISLFIAFLSRKFMRF